MTYTEKNFEHLIGTTGFSEQLLKNHFKLYGGYVANTNKLMELLDKMEPGTLEYSELQRRFGWEFNGMRLHELYFGNMAKNGKALNKNSSLAQELVKIYGSLENWEKNFKAVGAMRGIGWAALVYDPQQKEFFSLWINEHDVGHLAGTIPLLIMDVFEHAFMIDYGLNRADYIKAFMNAIDWDVVQKRFAAAGK